MKAELHCHNVFSNFHVGYREPPFDCAVSVRDQLERARESGIDALFVTNHNTLDGYEQMLACKSDHQKFCNISIFPAEEITVDTGAHLLAYGIHSEIRPGMTVDETIDRIRDQDGVSSAPHPFSLLDALRADASKCDMIEVFNSNNIDAISNARAAEFAIENKMVQVAGSDSHVASTLGRCVNHIDAEQTLDDAISALRHGHVRVEATGYTKESETLEHLKYKISSSHDYLARFIRDEYPNSAWFLSLLMNTYRRNPDSPLWSLLYRIAVRLMRRLSSKINRRGTNPQFMHERRLGTMFRMAVC